MISKVIFLLSLLMLNSFAEDYKYFYQVNLFNSGNSTRMNYVVFEHRNASLAVDGNIKTCAYGGNPPGGGNVWWFIKMDREYLVTHVIILYERFSTFWKLLGDIRVDVGHFLYEFRYCLKVYVWGGNTYYKESFEIRCVNSIFGNGVYISKSEEWLFLCEVHVIADIRAVNLAFKRPFFSNLLLVDSNKLPVDGDLLTCSVITTSADGISRWMVVLDNIYYVTDVTLVFKQRSEPYALPKYENINISDSIEDMFTEKECITINRHESEVSGETSFSYKCNQPTPGRYVIVKQHYETKLRLMLCEMSVYSQDMPEKSTTSPPPCLPPKYKCLNSRVCVYEDWLCDGIDDCPHGDDEDPSIHSCKGDKKLFKCIRSNEKVPIINRCDGTWECSDYSDEENCFDDGGVFLEATFKGISKGLICSENWKDEYSVEICEQYNRKFVETTKHIIQENKNDILLKINIDIMNKPNNGSFLALLKDSSNCFSNSIIGIKCANKTELVYTCGKRAFTDRLYGPYILNGQNAVPGAWPWHVHITIGEEYLRSSECGGTILNNRWILTASRCFKHYVKPKNIYVVAGSISTKFNLVQPLRVSHLIKKLVGASDPYLDDVTLLRLETKIQFSPTIRPICLPEKRMDNQTLMSFGLCVMAGFGWINHDGKRPEVLQQARMDIMEARKCQHYIINKFKGIKTPSMDPKDSRLFCAGQMPLEYGNNFCHGDTGGALVCEGSNGQWIQVGIASFHVKASAKGIPECSNSIFMRVDRFLDFIHSGIPSFYLLNFIETTENKSN